MKQFMRALAAAVLISGAFGATAHAAKKEEKPAGLSAEQIKKGMAEAPAAVASATGLQCTVKNAAHRGSATREVEKKKVKLEVYEVACNEGAGYMIMKPEVGTTDVYNCIKAQASWDQAKDKKQASRCELPENADLASQIQPVFAQTGLPCTATGVAWLGSSETAKIDRYELACREGGGYLLDVDFAGKVPNTPLSCLQAETGNFECKLTAKADRRTPIAALVARADGSCQMSDARWIGADPKSGNEFFEVGCNGKPGFFIETAKGSFLRSIDCVRAANIGGGCKMTDTAQARAGAAQTYAATLKANGVTCTPSDLRVIGKETNTGRDVIEFKCPERKTGIVAMIPTPGASGKFEQMDCFSAEARALACQLTTRADLLAVLKPILVAIEKVCEPSDYKLRGPDDADGDMIEVKCGPGQSGYVLDLPPSRAKTIKTLSCAQAARGVNKCEIPGNS